MKYVKFQEWVKKSIKNIVLNYNGDNLVTLLC